MEERLRNKRSQIWRAQESVSIRSNGIAIRKGYHQGKVILGYGNLTQGEIEEGMKRMKTVLDA